ncbi:hypothetical protein HPB51_024990 [Rhipicephalus microplus]|uniref:Enoyl-CoA hydratase domain-containing protein 3, mitochondrial n=1 Tax=Rhipicephalus microplus TaxID=6941 RepID=A0A9J6EV66_RHIMP|nr:hypothetical protein HPB51_024990 [Rhipicephalus microplus]
MFSGGVTKYAGTSFISTSPCTPKEEETTFWKSMKASREGSLPSGVVLLQVQAGTADNLERQYSSSFAPRLACATSSTASAHCCLGVPSFPPLTARCCLVTRRSVRELDACFREVDKERSVHCVVLSSSGPVFSSGHDLKELKIESGDSAKIQEIFSLCTSVMMAIRRLSVPVIAQVNGLAAAAGCQLVATCDIVLASDKATFSLPGAAFGLFCSTPGIAVARCVPQKMSAYMLFTGNAISAQEALRNGLVSKVVPEDKLQEETDQVVSAIKAKSKSVLCLGKKFYYRQIQMGIEDAYTEGERVMLHNLEYCDSQEGINAFAEKRKPCWEHTDRKI